MNSFDKPYSAAKDFILVVVFFQANDEVVHYLLFSLRQARGQVSNPYAKLG